MNKSVTSAFSWPHQKSIVHRAEPREHQPIHRAFVEGAPASTFLSNVIAWIFNDVDVRSTPHRRLDALRAFSFEFSTQVLRERFMARRLRISA